MTQPDSSATLERSRPSGGEVWPSALKKLSDAVGIELSMSANERDTSLRRPDFLTSDCIPDFW